jgi:hypothetical protein
MPHAQIFNQYFHYMAFSVHHSCSILTQKSRQAALLLARRSRPNSVSSPERNQSLFTRVLRNMASAATKTSSPASVSECTKMVTGCSSPQEVRTHLGLRLHLIDTFALLHVLECQSRCN